MRNYFVVFLPLSNNPSTCCAFGYTVRANNKRDARRKANALRSRDGEQGFIERVELDIE